MKKMMFSLLMVLALPAFADPGSPPMEVITLAKPLPANTVAKEHSSLKDARTRSALPKRMINYPTQVVRVQGDVKGAPKSCDEVFDKIDAFYTDLITYDKFFYNTILYCQYNVDTNYAEKFMINSYFDPVDENAVAYLEKYLAQHNGRNLLGTTFTVESAKGLIVSLNIDAGMEDVKDPNALYRVQHDNSGHYYTSNYAMRLDLANDIYDRFYSNDPDIILPFVTTWFKTSSMRYERVLSESDYVELRPELVFLMDKEPAIFTPNLRLYYAHHCSKYENKRCLA